MNMNEIARTAHDMKPKEYSKSACYDAMLKILDAYQDNLITDRTDKQNLQQLLTLIYAGNMPKAGKKPKTPEQWVSLAMSKKDVRYYLNYIYSDGNRIIATDGHRLHIYNTDKYEPGFYDSNMVKAEDPDFAKFPDVDRVIPDNPYSVPVQGLELRHIGTNQCQKAYVIPMPQEAPSHMTDVGVNSVYMDHALSIGEFTCVLFNDKSTAVSMSNGELLAVVMPIRLD